MGGREEGVESQGSSRQTLWESHVESGMLGSGLHGEVMMAQLVTALATKSDDLSLIPRTYVVEGKHWLPQVVL